MAMAALTVGLRFYTRRLILRILGIEDWLILAAMVRCPISRLLEAPSNVYEWQVLAIGACIGFIRRKRFSLPTKRSL